MSVTLKGCYNNERTIFEDGLERMLNTPGRGLRMTVEIDKTWYHTVGTNGENLEDDIVRVMENKKIAGMCDVHTVAFQHRGDDIFMSFSIVRC